MAPDGITRTKATALERNQPQTHHGGSRTILVRISEAQVRAIFGIVRRLAVPVLLGTSYIDKYARDIFPDKRKILPSSSKPVPILIVPEGGKTEKTVCKSCKNDNPGAIVQNACARVHQYKQNRRSQCN